VASSEQCVKCGLDLSDATAAACPACGTRIIAPPAARTWVAALFQFIIAATFMLLFGFPKIMIAILAALIVIGTGLAPWLKAKQVPPAQAPQKPLSHPVLFRIVSFGIALCSVAFLATLLFGFVIFMNAWTRWHLYEGQAYHQGEFQVSRVYYQKHTKGGADIFASGTVEGQKEWLSLRPFLHKTPHDQQELESLVPSRTSIPIYFFPNLKGRTRVQVLEDRPPAQASHRNAINTLNYSLIGLAAAAGIIFLLSRLRRYCFVESSPAFPGVRVGQVS
jgi:hypothetical protein